MPLIKIGIKGLAKFMTSSASAQRKVLWDYKNPKPEGQAQAKYYREAQSVIRKFHAESHDSAWLQAQAGAIAVGANTTQNKLVATRLENNARAIGRYALHFGNTHYQVLDDVKLALTFGDVQILVSPDLHVREGGKDKLLKFDFSEKAPESQIITIISQAMLEAALADGLSLSSSQILYIDVTRGTIHKGARLGARVRTNIEAACQNIAAIWPTL